MKYFGFILGILLSFPLAFALPSVISVASFLSVFFLIFMLIIAFLFTKHKRVKRKINYLRNQVHMTAATTLQSTYMHAYRLYEHVSEKQKAKIYPALLELRQLLENQLQAEKHLRELLVKVASDDPIQERKHFIEAQQLHLQLSIETQKRYQPQLLQLRHRHESLQEKK